MKIKTPADARKVGDLCMKKLVGEKTLVYFNLFVCSESSGSNCYFSPYSMLRGEKKKVAFVGDVEKILRLLLSHPKVSDLMYDPRENMISGTFEDELEDVHDEY